MSIPSWQRYESKLQVLWDAHNMRDTIENLVYTDFGYNVDTVMKKYLHNKKVKTYEELNDEDKQKYDKHKAYCELLARTFVPEQREIIMKYMRKVEMDLTYVDSIYPTTIAEWNNRRLYLDYTLADLNCLESEIQHTLKRLPTKKHAWKTFALKLGELRNRVYKLRTANNKLKNIILMNIAKQIAKSVYDTLCPDAAKSKGKQIEKYENKVDVKSDSTTNNKDQKTSKKSNNVLSVKPMAFNIEQFGLILHYGSSDDKDNSVIVKIVPNKE